MGGGAERQKDRTANRQVERVPSFVLLSCLAVWPPFSLAPTKRMDLHLTGKIAMVGGASKGLGFAVAHALAGEGARLCIASRDAIAIQRAADVIGAETGVRPLPVAADLSRADAIAAWHEVTIAQFGGVD